MLFGNKSVHCTSIIRSFHTIILAAGISTLDIRTRLRITEAELAIVQREVSDLLAERNILEASARQFEDSWKFTLGECGRVVEERDELQRRVEILEQAVTAVRQQPTDVSQLEGGVGVGDRGEGGGEGEEREAVLLVCVVCV